MSWFRTVICPLMIIIFPAWVVGWTIYACTSDNEWLIWGLAGTPITFVMALVGIFCGDFIGTMVLTENRRWEASLKRVEARERLRGRSTPPTPR